MKEELSQISRLVINKAGSQFQSAYPQLIFFFFGLVSKPVLFGLFLGTYIFFLWSKECFFFFSFVLNCWGHQSSSHRKIGQIIELSFHSTRNCIFGQCSMVLYGYGLKCSEFHLLLFLSPDQTDSSQMYNFWEDISTGGGCSQISHKCLLVTTSKKKF